MSVTGGDSLEETHARICTESVVLLKHFAKELGFVYVQWSGQISLCSGRQNNAGVCSLKNGQFPV